MPANTVRPRLAAAAADLVDAEVGIVRFSGVTRRQAGTPRFFHFWAQAADTGAFAGQRNFGRTGGAAADPERALAKALGEAVERYCAAIYDRAELPLRTAAEAEFPVVEPSLFALNAAHQYAEPGFWLAPFDRDTPCRWAAAVDAVSHEPRHVPAAMVYVPYFYERERGEQPIAQPISTGLACHESFARAAVAALCEVVERDAFTVVWQGRVTPPRIARETLPDDLRELCERFERTGFELTLLDVTLDNGVPTVLAVSRHRSPECPAVVVAAAASLAAADAARSALEELAHTGNYCQEIVRGLPRLTNGTDSVVDQRSHLNYWCDHANAQGIELLLVGDETQFGERDGWETRSVDDDLRELVRRIDQTGHRPLLCDLTTEDVATLGLAVVRAVVPGYHPLVSGHRHRALGGRRLWEVPQRLGYPGITPQAGDNPLPHPYP